MKINNSQRAVLVVAILAWVVSLFQDFDHSANYLKLAFIWLAILGLTGLFLLATKD